MTTKEDELLIALHRMAAHSGEAVAHLARKAIDAYMHAQQAEEPKPTVEERLDALEQRVQHEMDVNDSLARLNTDAHAALKHESMQAIQDHEYMHHQNMGLTTVPEDGTKMVPDPEPWEFEVGDEFEVDLGAESNYPDWRRRPVIRIGGNVIACVDPMGKDTTGTRGWYREHGRNFKRAEPEPLPTEAPPGPPEAERGARDRAAKHIKAHRDRLAANLGAQLWSAGVVIVKYDVLMALLDCAYSLFSPDSLSTAELAERLVKAYEKGN